MLSHFDANLYLVKMLVIGSLCFVVGLTFVGFATAQNLNEGCTPNTGGAGLCVPFDDCDLALLYKEGNNPKVCSWTGGDAIVCCPQPGGPVYTGNPGIGSGADKFGSGLSKSSQKCNEYRQIKCATVNATHTIVGGDTVENLEEFPHMALIGYGNPNNPKWQCGGTLISELYVLTAAHCLNPRDGTKPVVVNLGFLNKNNKNQFNTLQEIRIVDRKMHPDRKPPHKYADIALLKLERPAVLSKSVLPACLHDKFDIPVSKAQATGWGDTFSDSNAGSDELMKVTLSILDHDKCTGLFAVNRHLKQGIIRDQQFCAGEAKKDTCQGDSGGPLQIIRDDYCMHSIIGVTSFGDNCGIKPGVYTRVSHYVPWIESVVWP